MALFHLKTQTVGDDCTAVGMIGDADAATTPRLDEMFDTALEERRHVLLNFAGCDHVDTAALATITAGRERLGRAGLCVLPFAMTGVVRPIVAGAFAREIHPDFDGRPDELDLSLSLGRPSLTHEKDRQRGGLSRARSDCRSSPNE